MNLDLPLLDQMTEFATTRGIALPVFSDVARQIQTAAECDAYDVSAIERAIDTDPALAAEVLRAANSAFFGGLVQVSSVRTAITRLGFKQITNLAFLATEKNRYVAKDPRVSELMRSLWHHASACALASEWLAKRLRFRDLTEEAFLGGLMHDIGKLYLLRVLDEMIAEGPTAEIASFDLLQEVLDQAHCEQGHRLLQSWNLPEIYLAIVRDHHAEAIDPGNVPLVIVRLANHACNRAGIGLRVDPSIVLSGTAESHALGLSEVALAELEIILEDVQAQAAA
jgi:HD-like signal output (HDOD) protein